MHSPIGSVIEWAPGPTSGRIAPGVIPSHGITRQSTTFMILDTQHGHDGPIRHSGGSIRMPAPDLGRPVPRLQAVPEQAPSGKGLILLAEDEESVRRLCERVLAARGYNVVVAPNGNEAIEEARDAGAIDLLITDVLMPGCDGLELARKLRAETPDLPVLFISGYSRAAILDEVRSPARSAFLAKPFTTDALLRNVHSLLTSTPDSLGLAGT